MVASVRDHHQQKTVIILDQFEQLLTGEGESRRRELVHAMRQADGQRLQFVFVVRDEFWSSLSQLMRDLDAPLRDGKNGMAFRPFDRGHAENVLESWCTSLNGQSIDDRFRSKAMQLVASGDRVIPVRLALLAEVLGNDWSERKLNDIAARGSLSGYYLDSTVGPFAPQGQRRLTQTAKEILRQLTPSVGRIRGPSRSREELLTASRQASPGMTNAEFDDVMELLTGQLQLLTEVDRAASTDENDSLAEDEALSHFQLLHDFLVPELRSWLEALDRTSVRGRAVSDLRIASERWHNDRHAKYLAGPVDCVRFGLVAKPNDEDQRNFVRSSARRQLIRSLMGLVAAAVLLGFFQVVLLRSQGQATVQRLLTSSLDELPDVINEARRNDRWTRRPMATAHAHATRESNATELDRIALTRLINDPNQSLYLSQRIPELPPKDSLFLAIRMNRDLDGPDRDAVVSRLAEIASDESQLGEKRLKSAIAIAALDEQHSFWADMGEAISQLLVEANPTDLGWLADGLFPVRRNLATFLKRIREQRNPTTTRTATYLLAEFTSDDAAGLVALIEQAELGQLSAIFPAVQSASEQCVPIFVQRFRTHLATWQEQLKNLQELDESDDSRIPESVRANASLQVGLARKIGCLGAALMLRGQGELVLEQLEFSQNPTIRSYLIHCYAAGNGPAQPVVDLLVDRRNRGERGEINDGLSPSVAASLMQILGNLPAASQVPASLRNFAIATYKSNDHGELNATAEWYLRKQGYEQDLSSSKVAKGVGYLTCEGHTMIKLPGGITSQVGSSNLDRNRLANEERHSVEIPLGLYFSRHELSRDQIERFRAAVGHRPKYAGSDPAGVRIGFFEAAAYCNWLSELEGIPESEWCYLPNEEGEVGPGLVIVEDHLQRRGFQIPTPDLWEYACRGGTSTPKPFGFGNEVSSNYVRWMGTRAENRDRAAARLPNGFGLFDMLGSSAEWTVGLVESTPLNGPMPGRRGPVGPRRPRNPGRDQVGNPSPRFQPPGERGQPQHPIGGFRNGRPGLAFGGGPLLIESAGKTIRPSNQFAILGGAFDSPAHKVRSSDRSMISPPYTNKPITLRLMRIAP